MKSLRCSEWRVGETPYGGVAARGVVGLFSALLVGAILPKTTAIPGDHYDKVSKPAFPSNPTIYLSTKAAILSVDLSGTKVETVSNSSKGNYFGLGYYNGDNEHHLYVADTKTILRLSPDGEDKCTLLENTGRGVYGIAVDWESRQIYWTSQGDKTIAVARLDGTVRQTIFNEHDGVGYPTALALWPEKGLLFWADQGRDMIMMASLDGSRQMVMVNNLRAVSALTVDRSQGRLFWADTTLHVIGAVRTDRRQRQELIKAKVVVAIDVFDGALYWLSGKGNLPKSLETASAVISKYPPHDTVKMADAPNYKHLHGLDKAPIGIKIVHGDPKGGENPCSMKNGGSPCSHLCLAYPESTLQPTKLHHRCACGQSVQSVQSVLPKQDLCTNTHPSKCQPGEEDQPSVFLLYTTNNTIRRFSLDTGTYASLTWLRPQKKGEKLHPQHLTSGNFDGQQRLWFYDLAARRILQLPLSNASTADVAQEETIQSDITEVGSVHYREETTDLYWTQPQHGLAGWAIMVMQLNESDRAKPNVIVRGTNTSWPFVVTVSERTNSLVWVERGTVAAVKKQSLETGVTEEVANASTNVENIAIDESMNRVLWTDSELQTIEAVDLDGKNRKTVLNIPTDSDEGPVGLAVDNRYIYWTEYSLYLPQCTLWRADKVSPADMIQLDSWYCHHAGDVAYIQLSSAPLTPVTITQTMSSRTDATPTPKVVVKSSDAWETGFIIAIATVAGIVIIIVIVGLVKRCRFSRRWEYSRIINDPPTSL